MNPFVVSFKHFSHLLQHFSIPCPFSFLQHRNFLVHRIRQIAPLHSSLYSTVTGSHKCFLMMPFLNMIKF